VDKYETDRLELARWAVSRWAGFPVAAEPRPLVLAERVISSEHGFGSGEAKDAWFHGHYEWAVEVPEGVRIRAQRSANRQRMDPATEPLRITHAGREEREFLTDRGALTLPAYWLRGPSINGSLWVLDPEIDHWEPADQAGGPKPPAPVGQPLMRIAWLPIEVEADGRSIVIPWMGSPAARYRVELVETSTAISGVAIRAEETEPTGSTLPVVAKGMTVRVPARLSEPIGNRIFVDLHGLAMNVAASSEPATKPAR
jgi:hypothetical protein